MNIEEESESTLAKTHFLARMSHEMRTPLNAIIGMSTIAQTTNDIKKVYDCLDKINEASAHLLDMINDILDIAKIEAGNLKLSFGEFPLDQMLRKATDAKKFMLDAKKQQLIIDLDSGLPDTIISDEQRLTKVLDCFLSNAIKFTSPQGTITLAVKTLSNENSSCTLQFSVSDTGIGIPEDDLKKIFILFEQVDGGLARKHEGVGMGLPISASIVHLMGGEISVRSEPGKGSTFSFEITVETKEKKSEPEEDLSRDTRFQGVTILIAEDVEINREIVGGILEETGLSIDFAENGLEALEKYKANPSKYGLILMDIHMPEMDGLEATRQIRAFEKTLLEFASQTPPLLERPKGVPIVAMTANVYKADAEKCFAAGMNGHLGKPVDFEALIKELNKQLFKD